MAKEKTSEQRRQELHKSRIGGQALIEGIMMKGPLKGAMACRLPNGEIDLEVWDEKNGKNPPWYRKAPLVRGCVNFVLSMKDGYRCMMKSAEKQVDEDETEAPKPKQAEQSAADTPAPVAEVSPAPADSAPLPEQAAPNTPAAAAPAGKPKEKENPLMDVLMVVSLIFSIALAFGLFLFLPKWVVGLVPPLTANRILRSIAEGIVKIFLFVGYMAVTSLMKDIRITYEYHGAEHKTIACHEAHLPLTVENVRKQVRFHPRCGTSFIFIVLIVGIFAACFIPAGFVVWQRVLCSLGCLPLVVGISYEFIRLAGRYSNPFTRVLSAPGLWLQRITTREPNDKQIAVAIAAITPCIPTDLDEDRW